MDISRAVFSILFLLIAGLFSVPLSHAVCDPHCQNVSVIGQLTAFEDVSITTSGGNHILIVAIRNGNGTGAITSTITNTSLTWVLDIHRGSNQGWGHDLYCAIVPGAGLQSFRVNTNNGAVGIRILTEEYTSGVTCPASHVAGATGTGTTIDSGGITTSAAALIIAAGATDGDANGDNAGWSAGSGFSIRNPACNTGVEPDQKVCVEDKGIQASGTYNGTFGLVFSDSWDGIVASYNVEVVAPPAYARPAAGYRPPAGQRPVR